MSTNRINQQNQISRDQKLIVGIKKHFKGGSLVVAGKTYTADEAVAVLQAQIDALAAVIPAKGAWSDLVKTATAQTAQTNTFASGLRQTLKTLFTAVEALADFGISPPKQRKVLTVDEKAQAVDKTKATRAARHTQGKVQKSKVRGNVPAPSTSGSGPTPPK